MPKKGENIYKRKDGRWEGRYVKSRNSSGKIIYGYVYANDYSGPLAHPGRSLAQLDRASAHSTRSAVQPMLAADQHTC